MLNAHFCAGDGRVNENIALTSIHQVFHSEHDRLVDDIKNTLTNDTSPSGVAALAQWKLATGASGWNGARLFQAARFVTEMEYQHLVFEEFARKVAPTIRPFHVYHSDLNAVIPAEFAHAVFRFGHSMLDDDVARVIEDPVTGAKTDNSIPLLKAFLNPPEFFNGGAAGTLTPEQAAGQIFMGSSDQVGNEIDEFVAETLRNNLLGLPLDLPSINMARARSEGVPQLNNLRRQIFAATNDGQLRPYTSWSDFGQHLKHPESLINFVAAYGTHPTITSQTTVAGKRAAAKAIVDPTSAPATDPATVPADAADFMFSTGTWSSTAGGVTTTGVDDIDLWVGGLSEVTNLFGGLLGTTFNYVFQTTLESLQEGDRFYYLMRTPGMNLRAQLEGNSFAEMVQRNTDGTHTLKADVFATADCRFELSHLNGTAAGFAQFGSTVADDLTSPDCDESLVLIRQPDGTIQYRQRNTVDPPGINGQSVFNGTPGVDRVDGGNDNDTFWGGASGDIIDGQGGDDVAIGGDGNDRITDLDGADDLRGGPGNDALSAGPGDDLIQSGNGKDFSNAGINDNETFGGNGDDFIIAGDGADAVFGDAGDDWIEGGQGQDLLQGDHGAPFFDDPGQVAPGNDVFIGQVGENDYDTEGGDDLMSQNSAIDRNAGAGGFDWAIHQYDTVGADDDMNINRNLPDVLPLVVNRDRWQETEANSGSPFNDIIRGSNDLHAELGGAGFTGCDVLDQAGVDRISGLNAIVPQPLTGDLAAVVALSATKSCPLSGPIWGEGDILIGGAGSDLIEGRQENDIIDGDRELRVRISVRTNPADPSTEIGTTDLMEHQYLRDASGALTGPTLQADVFAGKVDPGNLVIVREIVSNPGPLDVDTAAYVGPQADYDITVAGGVVTVVHARNTAAKPGNNDGTDTLRNIERLQFADGTIPVPGVSTPAPVISLSPTSLTFPDTAVGATSAAQAITLTNSGTAPLNITEVLSEEVAGDDPAVALDFVPGGGTCTPPVTVAPGGTCTIEVTFTPSATGLRRAEIQVVSNAVGTVTPVSGNGIVAAAPVATLGATSSTFPDQIVGTTSAADSVTLTNSGNAPLSITGIALGGANPGDFTRGGTCNAPSSIAAGGSCTITLSFSPTATGARSASLTITTNAAGSPHTISVSGNGTAPPPIALLGAEVLQPSVDSNPAGSAEAFRVTASTTGTLATLRVFVDATSPATNMVAGLFSNTGTNHPGTLLARGSLTPTAGQWNNVPLANSVSVTAGTVYWIALLSPTGAGELRFRDRCCGGANQPAESSSQTNLANLPATWTTGQSFTDGPLSAVGLSGIVAADTTAPTVSVSSPANGATVSATLNVTAAAADNVGVSGVQMLLDGNPLGAEDTSAPYSVAWNTTTAANGAHQLRARARDGAGNTTTSDIVSVTVNNTVASPPPPPPPPPAGTTLFGSETVLPSADSNVAGSGEAFRITATASGALTTLRVWVDTPSAATKLVAGLYTNSATGHPGTLLTQGTLNAPTKGAWNSVTVPTASLTSGTVYWIALLSPAGSGTLAFRDRCCGGGSASETTQQTNLTTLAATWTTGTVFSDGPVSSVGLG
jgi:Ca2+-binding RTX toxin-like protein